jgi:transposase
MSQSNSSAPGHHQSIWENSMEDKKPKRKFGRERSRPLIERVNANAAGIDCGAAMHYVAVPQGRDTEAVRSFKTFTDDLERLADWLVRCGVKTVAMEATGVYWIPVFEIIESRGIQAVLVNAQHVKNVPGRKSDVTDSEWLQELHSVGLLRGSFRPRAEIAALRSYLRHRETLIQTAAIHMNRVEKALLQMNLQLHLVISDLTGQTGMRILRDIVSGERDPRMLARHRDARCKASEDEITGALTGHYRPEHLFVMKQNLGLYDAIQRQVSDCDGEIERHLAALTALLDPPVAPLPAARSRRKARNNEPRFEIRQPLHVLSGVDLSQIDGIGPYNALRIISEIGTDMSRWATQSHFVSWLTLAPKNRVSGGKLLSSRTQPSANRTATILRMVAMTLGRTQTALGAFYRRLAFRVGKAKAITATARKLGLLIYRCLKGEIVYNDPGAAAYDRINKESVLRRLRDRAENLGYSLVSNETGQILSGGVS